MIKTPPTTANIRNILCTLRDQNFTKETVLAAEVITLDLPPPGSVVSISEYGAETYRCGEGPSSHNPTDMYGIVINQCREEDGDDDEDQVFAYVVWESGMANDYAPSTLNSWGLINVFPTVLDDGN